MKSIRETDVRNKKVFVRVDFNVPMKAGEIEDDSRIKAALPTIQHLLENHAKIILGTHFGKPEGKPSPEFSTVPLAQRLAKLLGHRVSATDYVTGPEVTHLAEELAPGDILLLGNLRFDIGEEENDDVFAQRLAVLAELYVNEAFSVCHREAASVDAITKYLPSYAGFRLESEITTLRLLMADPAHPFVVIIGGVKVKDKAGMISRLAPKADKILVGGGVANTFLVAKGEDIGDSVFDANMVSDCQMMLQKYGSKIKLPLDGVLKKDESGSPKIMDIGPETVKEYRKDILNAKNVLWNGNLGYTEEEKYTAGTGAIAQALRDNKNTTVVAGGDTAGFLNANNLAEGISFISTGGGAALRLLAGERMAGIEALERFAEQSASVGLANK